MAEIVKFVYVMIIFVSPFLFSMNLDAENICDGDYDCNPNEWWCPPNYVLKCINYQCSCIGFTPAIYALD
ncbi:putative Late nodulin [Medicago truncatula]|uniref:Putative Late nodulin n=1 Tax=Medicago truncatula TaxID=3880 RepID=A0A396GMN3_MEDTR|nr:putative Late nodulin [Medicago truncatula]